ncbi:hypothetical protein SB768_25320 [Burkholderia sp. SIMBA_043]|jgi:hypothetical protein|uniref:hypothetical protein n=1 Tax=Burkholderia TaxID=32008 RepID=UPI0005D7D1B8|nr:hypothetical protein [Burkholderia vietnamiensis]AJY03084.1 hypothetical protein AK36_6140 [Burkholderia vietnamiensis LMG 10929]MCA8291443.1 hypothetical protein [Burkholderia vietnamiensis]UBI29234.1 hypothetical protein LA325_31035 [Burkholderia vietnamiensis]HDR9240175.1 hypothetical protein [Burkholderia vietnamiensis]
MHVLNLDTIRRVVNAIRDDRNPRAQADALAKRDQWLLEAELGTLQMSDEGRQMLESA